jgi:hypothetical protein
VTLLVVLRAIAVWLVIVALETIHGILRTLLLVSVMGDLSARRVSTLWPDGFSRRRFFNLTLREDFSPSRLLTCDFAEENATRSRMKEVVGAALGTAP